MITIKKEEQLLDPAFRKAAIEYFEDVENSARKVEAKRRYDVFKDKTKKYVLEQMQEESSDKTIVTEIKNRTSNVSFCRKIIDKKSQVYKEGVRRTIEGEKPQKQYDQLFDLLNIDSIMKKTNEYVELFKNTLVQVMGYEDYTAQDKWKMRLQVWAPYLYDVIADHNDRELMRVAVFSYFAPSDTQHKEFGQSGNRESETFKGSTINQAKEYVWWSTKFHFTTNEKGIIIEGKQGDELLNPIGAIPFIDFSVGKDGSYWAEGGEDIIDGAILLNILLTDLYYIAKYQGMGIGYFFGRGVPSPIKVGASAFVTLDMQEGDPTPQMGFATSSPPIQDHLSLIEQYVAFLLSTNSLEPGTVDGKLSGASASSGIQEMVKRSEMTEDIEAQREMYRDNEPELLRVISKWHNLLLSQNNLNDKFKAVGKIPEDIELTLKFNKPEVFKTEKEELDIIDQRMDIGLDSFIDAILRDNPDLTVKEAEEKYKTTLERKLLESSHRLKLMMENENGDQSGKDNVQPKPEPDDGKEEK